jgi:hypothetical protein
VKTSSPSQDLGVVSPRFRRPRCSYLDQNITFALEEKAQWSGLYECVTCHVCNAVYWLEDVGQRAYYDSIGLKALRLSLLTPSYQ